MSLLAFSKTSLPFQTQEPKSLKYLFPLFKAPKWFVSKKIQEAPFTSKHPCNIEIADMGYIQAHCNYSWFLTCVHGGLLLLLLLRTHFTHIQVCNCTLLSKCKASMFNGSFNAQTCIALKSFSFLRTGTHTLPEYGGKRAAYLGIKL